MDLSSLRFKESPFKKDKIVVEELSSQRSGVPAVQVYCAADRIQMPAPFQMMSQDSYCKKFLATIRRAKMEAM